MENYQEADTVWGNRVKEKGKDLKYLELICLERSGIIRFNFNLRGLCESFHVQLHLKQVKIKILILNLVYF